MTKKITILFTAIFFKGLQLFAQDSTAFEFDINEYQDASTTKKYCTQKVLNQVPTKQFGIAYEHNTSFDVANPSGTAKINHMGGLRLNANILAISNNKLILSIGTTFWSSKINAKSITTQSNPLMQQIFSNAMNIDGYNVTFFKPLDEKHFLLGQGNLDASYISDENSWRLTKSSLTLYGSVIYGWKKSDYKMFGLGISRTYRLGRPLFVPIFLYNQTFNDHWGVEALLPARGHVRYNVSDNNILLAGYELEGQQFDIANSNSFLQRGEIKPRIMLEKKIKGFFWLSAQLGYRINGRFNLVDRYDGQEKHENYINNWGNSPYFNIGINFVTP